MRGEVTRKRKKMNLWGGKKTDQRQKDMENRKQDRE